jgi:hypothetical protein
VGNYRDPTAAELNSLVFKRIVRLYSAEANGGGSGFYISPTYVLSAKHVFLRESDQQNDFDLGAEFYQQQGATVGNAPTGAEFFKPAAFMDYGGAVNAPEGGNDVALVTSPLAGPTYSGTPSSSSYLGLYILWRPSERSFSPDSRLPRGSSLYWDATQNVIREPDFIQS